MAAVCNKQGCNSPGTKFCGACGEASYCCVDCQKEDWKIHKRSSIDVNRLPHTFVSRSHLNNYVSRARLQADILKSGAKYKEALNLTQKLFVFLEHQLGVQIKGSPYYRRSDGEKVDNLILIATQVEIGNLHSTLSDIDSELASAIKVRRILECRDKSEDLTLELLSEGERDLMAVYTDKGQYAKAEHHSEQSLMFARLIKGEDRKRHEYQTQRKLSHLRASQGRHNEAVDIAEQAYILSCDVYGPMDNEAPRSVSNLIQCCMRQKDYSRADDYVRVYYSNLTDPRYGFDQASEDIADGMIHIPEICFRKDPVDDEEAEFALAEEAEQFKNCTVAMH